jgi:hypothetical protein
MIDMPMAKKNCAHSLQSGEFQSVQIAAVKQPYFFTLRELQQQGGIAVKRVDQLTIHFCKVYQLRCL